MNLIKIFLSVLAVLALSAFAHASDPLVAPVEGKQIKVCMVGDTSKEDGIAKMIAGQISCPKGVSAVSVSSDKAEGFRKDHKAAVSAGYTHLVLVEITRSSTYSKAAKRTIHKAVATFSVYDLTTDEIVNTTTRQGVGLSEAMATEAVVDEGKNLMTPEKK